MEEQIKKILGIIKSDIAGEKDRQEFLELFHQPEIEFELKNFMLEDLHESEIQHKSLSVNKRLFDRLWMKIEQKRNHSKRRSLYFNAIKIAAVLLIGLFIGNIVSIITRSPETVYYAAHAPRGSISEIILPDSSLIFLNADSRIRYSVEGKKGVREVFLTGEAWFDVKSNTEKPFVVRTGFYDVHVTGTKFNVQAYETDNLITTTLEEGEVNISSSINYSLAEDIKLKPGEQLILNTSLGRMEVRTVKAEWYSAWKENRLIFVNMNMKDLIVLLERKYGVDIVINNQKILDLHFDGIIKNESIIEILDIIKEALPIDYHIAGQKIEITDKQN